MWLGGIVAAADTPPAGVSDQIIIIIGGIVVAAITALGGVLVAVVNSRTNRTTASPPSPTPAPGSDHVLFERTAVLARRADDGDERDELQDRRIDQIERVLDLGNPDWRRL